MEVGESKLGEGRWIFNPLLDPNRCPICIFGQQPVKT